MQPAPPAHGWRPLVALLALIVVVAAAALTLAWRHADRPAQPAAKSCSGTGVVAHVDVTAAGAATTEQLQKAAAVLRDRLSVYGCSTVSVDGDRVHVSTSADGERHLNELLQPGAIEVRQVRAVLAAQPHSGCVVAVSPQAESPSACSKDGTERFQLGPARIVGSDVSSATSERDQQLGVWQIIVHFTRAGQKRFSDLTAQLVGKQIAIALDGVVISAPLIQERIDGDAQITGSFTESSAKALATILSKGALPVPLARA